MSFTPPRESFLQVEATNERVKEAQARAGRFSKKKRYDDGDAVEKQASSQGLLSRLMSRLSGQR